MVFHNLHLVDDHAVLLGNPCQHQLSVLSYFLGQDSLPVFRNPHEMVFEVIDRMLTSSQRAHTLTAHGFLHSAIRNSSPQWARFPPPSKLGGIQRGNQ